MPSHLDAQRQAYADLIIRAGVNLQPGQGVVIRPETGHRDFVRLLAARAYDAGASYVDVQWRDPITSRLRYLHAEPDTLDFVPDYLVARSQEALDNSWAMISLTGDEYPEAYEDVDPRLLGRVRKAWARKLEFFQERVMNNEIAWCVAAVPVAPWAQKVFPDLDGATATERLWEIVLKACRADQPDPLAAWAVHDANLKKVSAFMDRHQVRTIRYLDEVLAEDGRPATDLAIGLTDEPAWSCGSTLNKAGLPFFANIPTEEIFSTPHRDKVNGWVRTSKPGFVFEREVRDATFRFQDGQVVEWRAEKGQDVLDQLFEIAGARQLGELSLVDVRSPINQAGLIFHDTLFDENAVCHIAFGRGYPEGVQGGNAMSSEQLRDMGVNGSDIHCDLMIGTETMKVIGLCADGREVLIMNQGRFTEEVVA
jgi:aminopeptidase